MVNATLNELKINMKAFMLIVSLIKGIIYVAFLFSFHSDLTFILVSRFIIGALHTFESFYFIFWTDLKFQRNQKYVIPFYLSKLFGYVLGIIFVISLKENFNWFQMFPLYSLILFFLSFILLVFPKTVFN